MQNQIVPIVAEINTLESEGKALAKEWKSICKADKARFTKSTKADGFDTRLGKLMFALKQEGGQRISSARLKECGIDGIAKQRRAEALWFIENESEARAFMKTSKKGFTSLSALQKAMAKSAKADKADTEPKGSEGDDKSDVGLDEPQVQEQSQVTASDIACEVMVQVKLLAYAESITEEQAFHEVMLAIKQAATMADAEAA